MGAAPATAVAAVSLILALAAPARSQSAVPFAAHASTPTRLDDVVPEFRVDDQTLLGALTVLPGALGPRWAANLSRGLVYGREPGEEFLHPRKLRVALASATVRDILDALTAADTGYYWTQAGFVVDLLPKPSTAVSADILAALNQTLPSFTVDRLTLVEATAELVAQAKAQGLAGLRGPDRPRASQEVNGWFSDEEKISLSLKGKTVKDCLDALVAADPPAGWVAMPSAKTAVLSAIPLHAHQYAHRDLSAQERQALLLRYPDPPPQWVDVTGQGAGPK